MRDEYCLVGWRQLDVSVALFARLGRCGWLVALVRQQL
jgi:hypothetical protein